jgi:DNA polymerase-3 subunit gamma/tau
MRGDQHRVQDEPSHAATVDQRHGEPGHAAAVGQGNGEPERATAVGHGHGEQGRRPEPAGILPDAPEESGDAASAGVPGQLSAAAIREVWHEIITAVGRKSKKVAALASGATVRELDGQTVVLTFRFPAHAKMVAAEPDLIANALYEALGGSWQIRCEIAGEGDGVSAASATSVRRPSAAASTQVTPAHGGSARAASTGVPGRQREAAAPPVASAHSSDDDDWPEPARPGGLAATSNSQAADPDQREGGESERQPVPGRFPAGSAEPSRSGRPDADSAEPDAGPGGPGADVAGQKSAGPGGPRAASDERDADSGDSLKNSGSGGIQGAGGSTLGASVSGLAAARAAAAGARNAAAARPTAIPGPVTTKPSAAWSDDSPAEEPPYDPEYDGPVRPGAAPGYEGFDPGDEPLDDVIDEKTARQSSEQQAMQLLQDAFGAEKIGES